eukprot:291189-Rhodomonas_salina.1
MSTRVPGYPRGTRVPGQPAPRRKKISTSALRSREESQSVIRWWYPGTREAGASLRNVTLLGIPTGTGTRVPGQQRADLTRAQYRPWRWSNGTRVPGYPRTRVPVGTGHSVGRSSKSEFSWAP